MKCSYQFMPNTFILIGLLYVCFSAGCNFDPWPEPDPADDREDGEETAGGDDGYDNGADGGTSDTDTDGDDWEATSPDKDYIYCSAPGPDNLVTVVGLAGAVARGDEVIVRSGQDREISVARQEDGSFSGRIQAAPGESIRISAFVSGEESDPVEVPAGISEGEAVGGNIVGAGEIFSPDSEDQVAIHGDGERLAGGMLVIGGNISLSAGRDTLVSCSGTCQFDLFVPGETGDEIDLFLVQSGEHSGLTNSQTLTVP